MGFVGIILNCMMVAQVTVLGVLGLKEGPVAAPLIIPIIVVTAFFKSYINQRHFKSMECLPTHECHRKDASSDFYITESFEDLYVQPELLVKEAFPENASATLRKSISLVERKKRTHKKKNRRRRTEPSSSKTKSEPLVDSAAIVEGGDAGTPPGSI